MLQLVWRAACRDWQKVRSPYDSSFEAVLLFSLLGLIVSALYLTKGLSTPPLVSIASLFQGIH
jgi:hypothetical protein